MFFSLHVAMVFYRFTPRGAVKHLNLNMYFSITNNSKQTIEIPRIVINSHGVYQRANSFTKKSFKKQTKIAGLYRAIQMVDLTTLEGMDTDAKVSQLCQKAMNPLPIELCGEIKNHPNFLPIPSVAAVCVYPKFVELAKSIVKDSGVQVAAVSTAFPSGQLDLDLKLSDVTRAVEHGADEIDMVIDRDAYLRGDYQKVFSEIEQVKEICGETAHLKVILETSEIESFDEIYFASQLAMYAGADFIKTSTGKASAGASLPITLVMLYSIVDFYNSTGKIVGMKPAGGIRTAKQALQFLWMVKEVLGPQWLVPELFRFGASSLLNDLLRQICKQFSGDYFVSTHFSQD